MLHFITEQIHKQKTTNRCWLNVGPPSITLEQQTPNIRSTSFETAAPSFCAVLRCVMLVYGARCCVIPMGGSLRHVGIEVKLCVLCCVILRLSCFVALPTSVQRFVMFFHRASSYRVVHGPAACTTQCRCTVRDPPPLHVASRCSVMCHSVVKFILLMYASSFALYLCSLRHGVASHNDAAPRRDVALWRIHVPRAYQIILNCNYLSLCHCGYF